MDTRIIAAVTAAAAVMVGVGAAGPATASGDNQVVGIEQAVGDPAGGPQTSYTVSKIMPSADPVAYPVAGQLYEATVMARATGGTVVPLAGSFTALADDGATYPARAQVSSLSAAPLTDATTTGKIYFDVIGPAPTSVISVNPPAAPLLWHQPIPGESAAGGPGGGSSGGDGGPDAVLGSTGPNDVSPSTSGGEIGGSEGGTEGGGGNLSSGGGSGAPNGDTGGDGSSGGGG